MDCDIYDYTISMFSIRISSFGSSETMAWAIINLNTGDDMEYAQQDLS